ncbi:MAG: PDZ domain-containing protein, partial [Acidobacteriota bacterium]
MKTTSVLTHWGGISAYSSPSCRDSAGLCTNAALRRVVLVFLSMFLLFAAQGLLFAADQALMRFPTLHGDSIVFEAGGNLWKVGRSGGLAVRLTTDKGYDQMPRFSPDGSLIAFTGDFDGNTDVFTMPAEGGPVTRLTFHSDVVPDAPLRWGPNNMVVTWTPDGKKILFLSRRKTFNSWFGRLFLISKDGGLPEQLEVPKGGVTSFNADGTKIAYNRIFRNFRTWKDYYGGLAQDIWIYDLKTQAIERVTDWKGTDTYPMWYKDRIYFVSDRGSEGRLNLWVYSIGKKDFRQITHFSDFDIDWPSLGDTGIVFQCGGALYVVDLPSESIHKLSVVVPSDHLKERPRWVEAQKSIDSFGVSPNGKRALFGSWGEIFTVPAQYGDTRDLTQTSDAREQYPSWSPDGMNVAYVTDRTGEAELAVRAPNGRGGELVLTDRAKGYLYEPVWSPDSKKLAFSDSDHVLWYFDMSSRRTVRVDADPRREIRHYAWSPDGLWLTYSKTGENKLSDIYLYSLGSGQATRVTTGNSDDYDPVFGAEGKYLFFISDRHENPVFSESEFNIATLNMGGIYVATLQASEPSPFAPRSDEGTTEEKSPTQEQKKGEQQPGAIAPITIDLDGLASRIVPVPIGSANITHLASFGQRIYYMTVPNSSFEKTLAGETTLHFFDMKERKSHVLTHPLDQYDISADGKTLIYKNKANYFLSELSGDTLKPKPLDVSKMQANIDPPNEWNEMFHQAWRLERDFFFNPEMNGVDWPAVQQKYAELLPLVTCRQDLNYVIGQMLGELHNSHTYVGGGDISKNEHVPTGLLGVDFGLDAPSGRYYFKKIYRGDNSREDYRSPLTEPGVN